LIPDRIIRNFPSLNTSGCTLALGVDSASNTNEYQEYILGDKRWGCVGLTTLHLHVPIGWKFWEPAQACIFIALPLPLTYSSATPYVCLIER
jgi:hypothetical protein